MADTHTSYPSTKEKDPLSLFMQKARQYLYQYFKYIIGIIVLSLVVFGGVLLWRYLEERQNQLAEEELYVARSALIAAEKEAKGQILSTDTLDRFFDPLQKASEYTLDMQKNVEQYLTVIRRHLHRSAGAVSAMEVAYFLRTYGKNSQALELLQDLNKAFRKKNLLGFLLAFQLGIHWMNEGQYTLALEKFQWIQQQTKAQWLKPDVLLRMGLVYEKLNQPAKARTVYTQIKKDFTDSQAAKRAEQYLNLLQVEQAMNQKDSTEKTKNVKVISNAQKDSQEKDSNK